MTSDPASLDRLHDIVLPAAAPWWPLAPAWWMVLALLGCALVSALYALWQQWVRSAYRRAALAEYAKIHLLDDNSVEEFAALLKRTAMAAAGREATANLTGRPWIAWLESTGGFPMPERVKLLIQDGVYQQNPNGNLAAFAHYVEQWIRRHQLFPGSSTPG